MNQFKDVLLGKEKRDYKRAASSQKCIRAGGKHNDLENVGHTSRHLTFFEMLGNWSFGDYYKKDAIKWAWEFLTETLKLPVEKLYVSIYRDDDESFKIWNKDIGVPENKIIRLGDVPNGDEENFWSMGPTGPCGPCTEIHYDTGKQCSLGNRNCGVACDCDRFLEIWNNVFMEFNRDEKGNLTPLKMKSVDTGMGLERLAAILQNKETNFDIDIFEPVISGIEKISRKKYKENPDPFRVIADHIRCLSFAIADGGLPSNEGRGYVLRRILRRALRYAKKIGINEPFLFKLADTVIFSLGDTYPELSSKESHIKKVIFAEEERFLQTLDRGIEIFNKISAGLIEQKKQTINGKDVFLLYDTFGFPVDLTDLMAKEIGLGLDIKGFEAEMEIQKENSKKHSKFAADYSVSDENKFIRFTPQKSEFCGYSEFKTESRVIAYRKNFKEDFIELILERTPFYGESGGQIGDTGIIRLKNNITLKVLDAVKLNDENICICKPPAEISLKSFELSPDDVIYAEIDIARRKNIQKNHTATHLLHKALRQVVGNHCEQSGSNVSNRQFRFDFSHYEKVSAEQLSEIEKIVNSKVQENLKVEIFNADIETAKKMGATALFGEKYGNIVRVVKIEDFSMELCGGAHIGMLGEIGVFKILSESAAAAGIRRIEAVTGTEALNYYFKLEQILNNMSAALETDRTALLVKIEKLKTEYGKLLKENEELKLKSLTSGISEYFGKTETINGINFLFLEFHNGDIEQIKMIADEFRKKYQKSGIILAANINDNSKAVLCVGLTKDMTGKFKAGDVAKIITTITGGGGGGTPMFAQAGVKDVSKLKFAIDEFKKTL